MAKRLIPPLIALLLLVGALVYVGSTRWVELRILPAKPQEISDALLAMSLQAGVLFLTGAVLAIVALWSLIVWLWRLPRKMKSGLGRRREANGIEALEQSLLAAESGQVERARKKAKKAHELLEKPALTHLVFARTAELSGDFEEAQTHYNALLEDEATAAAGYRGLARLAEIRGDYNTAARMADAALNTDASPDWAFDLLFRAQIALGDWEGALDTLNKGKKLKSVDADTLARRRAVVLSALAAQEEAAHNLDAALDYANQAVAASPGFAPAAALAARLYALKGQHKKAASMIEKAWKHAPHPALAQAYKDLFAGEKPTLIEKRLRQLAKLNPDHRESAIMMAEFKLEQKDGVGALKAIGDLLAEPSPSARLCLLAAKAESLLGNPVDAGAWQSRAANAPLEADWSDLDPDGPAFNYSETDWKNLVVSYGETGTLIHPRYGAKPRRDVGPAMDVPTMPATSDGEAEPQTPEFGSEPVPKPDPEPKSVHPPSPDNPGIDLGVDKHADLSSRLDKLLGDKAEK
ncbi:MAG TPA: heme biosynthesis protein HemY [Hellea balneolensis]|uniref:Heme biosynthesis protein HemY n=1 Tax=Hellea balneolensis TaxID=287478 RepID=A0A7C5R7P4_9PROT|nr:heme biosynthesis protein HemY [Hellea balneolensis]